MSKALRILIALTSTELTEAVKTRLKVMLAPRGRQFSISTAASRLAGEEFPNFPDYDLVIAGDYTRRMAALARRDGVMTLIIDNEKPPLGGVHLTPTDVETDSSAFSNMVDLALSFRNNHLSAFPATKAFETPQDKIKAALSGNFAGCGTHALAALGRYINYYLPGCDRDTVRLIAQYFNFEETIYIGLF